MFARSLMGVTHHPSAQMRADYRIGNLAPGAALAVAAHLTFCDSCALAALEFASADMGAEPPVVRQGARNGLPPGVPRLLSEASHEPWRRVASGVRAARLEGVAGLGESVHFLEARPGARLRLPSSVDTFMVVVGRASSPEGELGPGDFLEGAAIQATGLRAAAGGTCLCLVSGGDDLYRGALRSLAARFGW